MEINTKSKPIIPDVPNQIETEDGKSIPIYEISEKDLKKIGKEWTENLVSASKNDNQSTS